MTNTVKTGSKLKFYLFIISMLAISFVHFALFWVYVNFDTIRLTFYKFNRVYQEYTWCGLENYKNLFEGLFLKDYAGQVNPDLLMFKNTFKAIIINLILLPMAVLTAYAFYKKVYAETTFRVIFYLPSIISVVVQVTAFLAMFKDYNLQASAGFGEHQYGPYAKFFSLFGYEPNWLDKTTDSQTLWPLIYAFCIIAGLGTNVILMSSAMLRIPSSIAEAAELDGCGFYRELFVITIPLIMPTITTWMTALLTSVFGFMMQPMLIASDLGQKAADTISWRIFRITAGNDPATIPAGATLGLTLSLMVMPVVIFMRWLFNKLTPEVSF